MRNFLYSDNICNVFYMDRLRFIQSQASDYKSQNEDFCCCSCLKTACCLFFCLFCTLIFYPTVYKVLFTL